MEGLPDRWERPEINPGCRDWGPGFSRAGPEGTGGSGEGHRTWENERFQRAGARAEWAGPGITSGVLK